VKVEFDRELLKKLAALRETMDSILL